MNQVLHGDDGHLSFTQAFFTKSPNIFQLCSTPSFGYSQAPDRLAGV
jgi:hypothetical protein